MSWIIRAGLAAALVIAGCGDDATAAEQPDAAQPATGAGAEAGSDAAVDAGLGAPDAGLAESGQAEPPGVDAGAAPGAGPDGGPFDGGPFDGAGAGSDGGQQGEAFDGGTEDAAAFDGGDDAATDPDARSDLDASGDPDGGDTAEQDAASDAAAIDAGSFLTYYRDAKPILDAKCTPCHYAGGIGPFPLATYAEVAPYAALIRSVVAAGLMPPWQASGELGVYVGDRRLDDAQKSTLLRWIDEGALAGVPEDAPAEVVPPDTRSLERVDLSLPIDGPYTPGITPDDYRCFVLDWPYADTKYVTGISIEPDRVQSVHHAILYLEPPENATSVLTQDLLDPGPGFTCFSNTASLATWLSSYEPGGFGQSVPSGLGFEVRPGSLMVLQVHYNSLNGTGPDTSRVDFTIADSVERVGNVMQLLDTSWVLGFMPIPADDPDVVHRWRGRPSRLGAGTTYDIQWVDLHMHTLGSRGSVSIVRATGALEPLLDIPDWDFNWQQTYVLKQPVKLFPGDQLDLECHFDNTAENQLVIDGRRLTPRDVNWGEGTADEMCLGNVLVTPAQ